MDAASEPDQSAMISVSVVVPVYSGAEYLTRLCDDVAKLREMWRRENAPVSLDELILVDDAAIDESPSVIDGMAANMPWLTALHLSRNFGQHGATVAGVLHSSGDWVVTMDEDLQHPPARIPDLLIKALSNSSDVVYAQPTRGVHKAFTRDLTSRTFKRFMRWLTGNPKLEYINSFRLMRGTIARAASSVCTHDTYFDVNLAWFTQRIDNVRMDLKDERYTRTGRSGYTLRSLLSHAWRMLFSSHIKILRLGAVVGGAVLLLSVLGSAYLIAVKLLYPSKIAVQGWASLVLIISFFGGLSIFMLGICLQYLSTLVLQAHGKPTFFPVDRALDANAARWLSEKLQ